MTMQAAVTEYLERERKAISGPGHVDLRQLAGDVAKEYDIDASKLRAAIIDTLAGPC
jgi:hypothetical protein